MIKTIFEEKYDEGVTVGVAQGKAEGKAEGVAEGIVKGKVLTILQMRFHKVSKRVENSIRSMTDLIALESLAEHAKICMSLDEFVEAIR